MQQHSLESKNPLDEGVGLGQQRAPVQVGDVDRLHHVDKQQAARRRVPPRRPRLQQITTELVQSLYKSFVLIVDGPYEFAKQQAARRRVPPRRPRLSTLQ